MFTRRRTADALRTLAEQKRSAEAKKRKEEAERKREERIAEEDADHEEMVRAYHLGGNISWLAKHIKRGRTFEKSCAIAEVNPDEIRNMLVFPPIADEWNAHYVLPAIAYLRARLATTKVKWE
jgi:hypothetical protein